MEKYQSSTCSCCGKPLSDPISVELGIGPVCRVTIKMKDMNEKTGNLFSNRSDYDYRIDGNILSIEDLGGLKSVTNDIENVLCDIFEVEQVNLKELKIMYKDSMGIWDGVRVTHFTQPKHIHVEFFSLNERLYNQARTKLLNMITINQG